VFTKFSNMINGVITNMEVSGTPLSDLPEDQQVPAVLRDAQTVINTFKISIEKVFNDVIYFIYDPSAENYFADSNLKVYYEEVPQAVKATSYAIESAHMMIRKDLNIKFLKQVQDSQVTRQISQMHKSCRMLFNKLQQEALNRENIEKVIDREMAQIEKANEKQAKIQAKCLDEMFNEFGGILTETFDEAIKANKAM
jgi:hypothetical protein